MTTIKLADVQTAYYVLLISYLKKGYYPEHAREKAALDIAKALMS